MIATFFYIFLFMHDRHFGFLFLKIPPKKKQAITHGKPNIDILPAIFTNFFLTSGDLENLQEHFIFEILIEFRH